MDDHEPMLIELRRAAAALSTAAAAAHEPYRLLVGSLLDAVSALGDLVADNENLDQ